MSDSYIGWDGNSYPWPPPDGWHEASDGRWWAPGTGPNPPSQAESPLSQGAPSFSPGDLASQTAPFAPVSNVDAATEVFDPAGQRPPDQGQGGPPPGAPYEATGAFATGGTRPGPGLASPHTVPSAGTPLPPPGAAGNVPPPASSGQNGGRLLLIGLGVLAALALLAGGLILLPAGDDNAASSTSNSVEAGADTSTDTSDTDTDTDTGESTTTSSADGSTDSAAANSSSSSVADGPSTAISDQIARFRELLGNNDLTSDALTDADVETFGSSFCSFASLSPSTEVFDEFRSQAIQETANTALDPDELSLVIDAALVAFCPDEAQRLGIGL